MATTISRTWYDTLVDDSGSGTDGTILDKADFDAILDAIDALFVSALAIDSDLVLTGNNAIRRNTSDASDTGYLGFTGGGAFSSARGAILTLAGNEYAGSAGLARVEIGNVTGGKFVIQRGAGTSAFEVNGDSGAAYINDTSNANLTIGLTINQGANDNECLALKSSDISHLSTSLAEADTFATFKKAAAGAGLTIDAYGVANDSLLQLRGHHHGTSGNVTRSTAGLATLVFDAVGQSAGAATNLDGDINMLAVRNNTTTRFILDSDGDSHQDVGTAWTNFDADDDVMVLNLLAAYVTRPDDPLKAAFGKWLLQSRDILERLRLVTFNDDGHHFVNMSRLTMLLVGAVRQMGHRLERLEQRSLALEDRHG